MSLVTRANVNSAGSKAMDAGIVIGSAVGGIAGFFAADSIGFTAVVSKIWKTAGIANMAAGLGNVETLVTSLIAAGIYIAIGIAVTRLSFDGKAINIVTKTAGWFFLGCGIRSVFSGITSGVTALKSAGK